MQVLGVANSNSDVDVVKELRSRLEAAGLVATSSSMTQNDESISATVAAETVKHESTIAELKTSNESLKAKLKNAKQRHTRDVVKLQKTVAELQQRVKQKHTAEVERSGVRSNVGSGEVGATSAESSGGVVLPPVSVASPQSRPSLSNPQTTSAGDHDHNSAAVQLSTSQAPSSPVVMPPLPLPKTSPTTTARTVPPTTAIVLPSLAADSSVYQPYTNEHTSTSLRSQVGQRGLLALYNNNDNDKNNKNKEQQQQKQQQ